MATTTETRTAGEQRSDERQRRDSEQRAPVAQGSRAAARLDSDMGRTTISDAAVAKIAGVATREVNGIVNMGTGAARAFGGLRERLPGSTKTNYSQGVHVEVGERQAAVDVDVVVEYGASIPDVADGVRRNVASRVGDMTGLEVVEVNISVDDVALPEDLEGHESRVE